MTDLVSIGLPIYNESKYINRTIESWLAQDYSNFELIIVDNASTDGTAEICREYSHKDKRIRLIENLQNIGTYRNHKLAFELSCGKYFTWAGGHDHVHPSFVSKTIEVLNANPGVVMCTTRSEFRDEHDESWRTTKGGLDLRGIPPHERYINLLQHATSGGTANLFYGLYRRETVSQVVEFKKNIGADIALLMQVALLGEIVQLDDVLYYRFVPRDARKDNKRIHRHVRDIFGENSFEVGAQMPNVGMLFGYMQVIEDSDLSLVEKQFMFESIMNESRRIQNMLIAEFENFITKGKDEIFRFENDSVAQRYRAIQILNVINRAGMFGLASTASADLQALCQNLVGRTQGKLLRSKPRVHNILMARIENYKYKLKKRLFGNE